MSRSGATSAEIEAIYRDRFSAFVLAMTAHLRERETALDAVQDGFALGLDHRRRFRGDGSLEAWLWRIVLNVTRDRLRARRGHRDSEQGRTANESETDNDLRAALLALPERQRLAIFLRYYADLSYQQIADNAVPDWPDLFASRRSIVIVSRRAPGSC
jgi:RNA polymerase sigma factor (sigma-70 family)